MSYKQNFANLINIFTVIIDQFDALLLNTKYTKYWIWKYSFF